MKILITNLGSLVENVVSSSIIKGILHKHKNYEIYWCVNNDISKDFLKYNKHIKKVLSLSELYKCIDSFDLWINLYPNFPSDLSSKILVEKAIGIGFDDKFNSFFDDSINKDYMNMFQMYFKAVGLSWRGEGYYLGYFPKNKTKRTNVGVAVANLNIRNYIYDKLDLEESKLWHIPYKKSILKKMDEINRCKSIITDDLLTFHLSVYLHKYVYFLKTFPIPYKLEFFGKGEVFEVPPKIFYI
ncbi:MAG: hypothetical protein WC942_10380 [Clostridia bacterium]|jgi:hypothetical protein